MTDTVDGLIRAAEAEGIVGQTIHLGTGEAVSIGALANQIGALLGLVPEIVSDDRRVRPARSEVTQLISDNTKARKLLNWQPAVSLREGLTQTIAWMREHREDYHPEEYAL